MSINISVPDDGGAPELKPRITVLGVGGAGGNAVNNMIAKELQGVDFVVANTDAQALVRSKTDRRVQLGADVTEGLGAGSRPDVGRIAAEESMEKVMDELDGAHMVFVAAGMGGGTGTGAAPIIAKAAKERGILTVAVVTKPFQFEGSHRMRIADAGIQDLESYVDTLIIIPNQNLFRIANESTTFADAFAMADEVLYSGVRGVTDLMTMPGLINLDFADIRAVMGEMGKAMMGTGEAEGDRRALEAAEAAINNPLLDDSSMKGAKGVLINITGGRDITLFEVDEAANRIRSEVDQDAHIIIGSAFDGELDGMMRVSVVATGIDAAAAEQPRPQVLTIGGNEPKPDQVKPKAPEAPVRRVPAAQTPAAAAMAAAVEVKPAAAAPVVEAVDQVSGEVRSEEQKADDASDFEIKDDAVEPAVAVEQPAAAAAPSTPAEPADAAVSEEKAESQEPTPIEAAVAEAEPVEAAEPEEVKEVVAEDTPPPAMPSIGATDAFIPKPGVEDKKAQELADEADPLAESAVVNGDKGTTGKSGGRGKVSLFELVTGTGKAAIDKVTGNQKTVAPEQPTDESSSKSQRSVTQIPTIGGGTPSVTQTAVAEPAIDPAPQPALGGLNPDDRVPESAPEQEDLLDIPAFLRRQAN